MKRELIKLSNGRIKKVNNVARVYALYDWLKENAVGEQNKKSACQIILALNEHFKTRQNVEDAIQVIRMSLDLMIGSNTNGYWIICETDKTDGYAYIKNQALSKMKIAIMCGVDPNIIYKELNEYKNKCNSTNDGQVVLADTPYQKDITRRYGDYLLKEDCPREE